MFASAVWLSRRGGTYWHSRYKRRVSSPHFCQLYCATTSAPRARARRRAGSSLIACSNMVSREPCSCRLKSKKNGASRQISGRQEVLQTSAGHPAAIASSGGNPKPSHHEG